MVTESDIADLQHGKVYANLNSQGRLDEVRKQVTMGKCRVGQSKGPCGGSKIGEKIPSHHRGRFGT